MSVGYWTPLGSSIEYVRLRQAGEYNYLFIKGSILQHIYLVLFRGYKSRQGFNSTRYMVKEIVSK